MNDHDLDESPSVVLTKVRLLKQLGKMEQAYSVLKAYMESHPNASDVVKTEYIKILIQLGKREEVVDQVDALLENLHQSLTKHYCENCGYNSDEIFWRCPQCHEWETIQFRWKV